MSPTAITKETLIPIGLAISLIAPLFFTAIWINNKLLSINNKLSQIELRLSLNERTIEKKIANQMLSMDSRVKKVESSRWTRKDQIIWAQYLQIQNSNLKIPLEFVKINTENDDDDY